MELLTKYFSPNVDMPKLPMEQIRGAQVTHQNLRLSRDVLEARQDPRGQPYYWTGSDSPNGWVEEGRSFGALAGGRVSLTPLDLDMTTHEAISGFGEWDFKPEIQA